MATDITTDTVVYTAKAADAELLGDLSYSLSGADADYFNFDSRTGELKFKDAQDPANGNTEWQLKITATDGVNPSNTLDLTIWVKDGIAISDSTVSTLLDAGILSVDTASTIEVDADAQHMSTSLLQPVDIGADKGVTSQDKVVVDLGEVTNLDQLSALLSSLLEDSADTDSSTLFVQADGENVQEVGLVFTADQAALANEIESKPSLLAQLTHVGITELLVATDDGADGDVHMLGHEYHKQPLA